MDNNINHISPPPTYGRQLSEEENAMMDVLNMKMMDLLDINIPIHDICLLLCQDENLLEFSYACGNTLAEWKVYDAMIKNHPDRLPAKTFLQVYFKNNKNITLRDFMRILLRMRSTRLRIHDLLKALWNAALYGNSQYFRNLQEMSQRQ